MSREKHPRSRWIKDGPTPRYDERALVGLLKKYKEQPGWFHGARVYK